MRRASSKACTDARRTAAEARGDLAVQGHAAERRDRAHESDLKWLSQLLGPARDLDVLVTESVAPLRREIPDKPEMKLLETELEQRRERGFAGRRPQSRASDIASSFGDRPVAHRREIDEGQGRTDLARREQPAAAFAADVLRLRLRRSSGRAGSWTARCTVASQFTDRGQEAALRDRILFGPVRPAKAIRARNRFGKDLKALQSAPGKVNDITEHQDLTRPLVHRTGVEEAPGRRVRGRPAHRARSAACSRLPHRGAQGRQGTVTGRRVLA